MREFSGHRRVLSLIISFCLVAGLCTAGPAGAVYGAEKNSETISGDYAEDQILVVFEEDVNKKEAQKIVDKQDGQELTVLDTPQEEIAGVVDLPEDQTVEEAVRIYEKNSDVAFAQPNYRYSLIEDDAVKNAQTKSSTTELNDPYAGSLWHLDTIRLQEAWNLVAGRSHTKTRVAVLDTGVDTAHPDLQANLNKSLCRDTSDHGNVHELTGDDDGHGTHVSGIIAATANNSAGVAGVASGADNSSVELFAVDVFRYSSDPQEVGNKPGNYAFTDSVASGLSYASNNGAKVINMSLGMYERDPYLELMVNAAAARGTTIVCASGNDHTEAANYPSDFEPCISVISTNQSNEKSDFSNYGSQKDIAAPGGQVSPEQYIWSTYYGTVNGKPKVQTYAGMCGTSQASPIVAGVAALLYSVRPELTVDQVKNMLYSSATDVYSSGWDKYSGYGVVNAYGAVYQATRPYSITYHLNGGKNNGSNPYAYDYGGSVSLKNPTRKGYTFGGWYTASNYTNKVTSISGGDYDLYAKWNKVSAKRTSIKSLKRASKTKLKATYKKISGAAGYQITYSVSKKFSKKKTKSVTAKATKKTLTKLKKGKTYYVKVRAYKKDSTGAKVYGKYSKVKKLKLKK